MKVKISIVKLSVSILGGFQVAENVNEIHKCVYVEVSRKSTDRLFVIILLLTCVVNNS